MKKKLYMAKNNHNRKKKNGNKKTKKKHQKHQPWGAAGAIMVGRALRGKVFLFLKERKGVKTP